MEPRSSVSNIIQNYVIGIIRHVQEGEVDKRTKGKLLDKALDIAEFHEMTRLSIVIESMMK